MNGAKHIAWQIAAARRLERAAQAVHQVGALAVAIARKAVIRTAKLTDRSVLLGLKKMGWEGKDQEVHNKVRSNLQKGLMAAIPKAMSNLVKDQVAAKARQNAVLTAKKTPRNAAGDQDPAMDQDPAVNQVDHQKEQYRRSRDKNSIKAKVNLEINLSFNLNLKISFSPISSY